MIKKIFILFLLFPQYTFSLLFSLSKDTAIFKRGEGSIIFTAYEPLRDKPVTIYYYIPTHGNIQNMRVLFSMHGAERNGQNQLNTWKHFAEEFGFIILAPEYSKEYYTNNDYQFGGISESLDEFKLRPAEQWTYKTIEAIFDYFKAATGNKSEKYDMYGHSGGGQFVHRYLLALPEARVCKAVASNPGSWTFPCKKGITGNDNKIYGWPYSIKNTPFETDEYIQSFFEKTLYVQLGTADTGDTALPKDIAFDAQGAHRYERGKSFFNESQRIADEMNVSFKFQLVEVKDVGHSNVRMVYGKSELPDRTDIEDVGENGAFSLIYR